MEKLTEVKLDLINGGLAITSNGQTITYSINNAEDIKKLEAEFKKNNQVRNIDITYAEYINLVDKGIIPKNEQVYAIAKVKVK